MDLRVYFGVALMFINNFQDVNSKVCKILGAFICFQTESGNLEISRLSLEKSRLVLEISRLSLEISRFSDSV